MPVSVSRDDDVNGAALEHIAGVTGDQRTRYHSVENVSLPRLRKLARWLALVWVRVAELVGGVWRRLTDSHRWPGRWGSRVKLYHPWYTITPWVLVWGVLVALCSWALFTPSAVGKISGFFGAGGSAFAQESAKWILGWALGGSFAALVASLWHDGLKSPYTAWRIRRRLIDEPEALLRMTIAKQENQIVELEPPVNTVPRDDLYDELLPGVLSRRQKDVQIIVGVPGGGKTTALLDMAGLLAKIGFVPVLLELRGQTTSADLFEVAKARFAQQVRPKLRADGEADLVWRWLCRRQRVVILIDDVDQIGFDGEPGFAIRRLLESLATEGQPVIVTARPAGVPAGIAASSIRLEPLGFETSVKIVAEPKLAEPGTEAPAEPPQGRIERWIRAGSLAEAPLYLEALTEMTAAESCPDLPEDPDRWGEPERPGRRRRLSRQRTVWNPLWVRYRLLSDFYAQIVAGKVRRSLAIDPEDRKRSVGALEAAALGTIAAAALEARSTARHGEEPAATRIGRPRRTGLVDFIDPDDRRVFVPGAGNVRRRKAISQHEAIDTGERLRILERDRGGEPQFRHRIMQAFLAGRRLARLGRDEMEALGGLDTARCTEETEVKTFEQWLTTLLDKHHPEKLTAHLALVFAAVDADERSRKDPAGGWGELADRIVDRLVEDARGEGQERALCCSDLVERLRRGLCGDSDAAPEAGLEGRGRKPGKGRRTEVLEQLDPLAAPDPGERRDPDDQMIKLTTAANIAALLRPQGSSGTSSERHRKRVNEILDGFEGNEGAMRWTKLEALPAIAALGGSRCWTVLWHCFTVDADYEVRRAAGRRLEESAWFAFPSICREIDELLMKAGDRTRRGKPLDGSDDDVSWPRMSAKQFEALGWVLPAIVSGLSEEMRIEGSGDGDSDSIPPPTGANAKRGDEPEALLHKSRNQLESLTAIAYEGCHHPLEDALAQGFKADAMRHASHPAREITGPGWVASNRRLVADVAIPNAGSWYARMLLYQALVLYAVAGKSTEDTLDLLAYRLHGSRERHPLVRQATKLARSGLRRAQIGRDRWVAFIWSDDVEDGGRLPAWLDHQTAQLLGDVAVLIDLKEGSPPDCRGGFGHMEELPYCLSGSKNRHEILGTGCPKHCGWGFCPYRAASPDEPEEHRGVGRVFARGQRRIAHGLRPSWQRSISQRRMREFWRQMEFKARR